MPTQFNVAEINLAVQTGDRRAWEKLYPNYFRYLSAFFKRKFEISEQDSSGFIQETLMRLSQKKPQFSDIRQFHSWIIKTSQNLYFDWLRKNKTSPEEIPLASELTMDDGIFTTDPRDAISMGQLQPLLSSLNETERKIIPLVAQGYKSNEIANQLRIAPSSVRVYLKRAKEKIRGALDGKN